MTERPPARWTRIGVLGAMEQEVARLRADMSDMTVVNSAGREYYVGSLYGHNVALVFSGWGKVASASTVTTLFERFDVDAILFAGVAGAVSPVLNVGDVVVASELIQHDLDPSPIFRRYEIPRLGVLEVPTDERLSTIAFDAAVAIHSNGQLDVGARDALRALGVERPRVVRGLVISGDEFIADPRRVAELRAELPESLCVEMEGAAVAQVCLEHGRPFCVVRMISDRADHAAGIDFPAFVSEVAAPYSAAIVAETLRRL